MSRPASHAAPALAALALVLAGAAPAAASTFTVAPGGDDGGPGTAARPWRTIAHAARTVPPGSVVDVRAGTYRGRVVVRVSGRPGAPVVFRAHPGERVVISGRRVSTRRLDDLAGLVHLEDRSHVRVEGFVLSGLRDRRRRFVPAGVVVRGAGEGIVLRGLEVTSIGTRATREDGNAHGIAVYGTRRAPLRDVRIEDNHVHDLRLGASEAIVVNGNVTGWAITGNRVDDVDNIGIDAIGLEGTAPADDRARDGRIEDNVVSDVDTLRNPAYDDEDGRNCRCAGGIYVDGGARVLVRGNRVVRANIGIELASEARDGTTEDVLATGNVVRASDGAGISLGGYDARRGRTVRTHVVGNRLAGNDRRRTGAGEIALQHRIEDSSLVDNVVVAGRRGLLVASPFRSVRRVEVDGNTWWTAAGAAAARWQWRGRELESLGAWQEAVGGAPRDRLADPDR